jgi:hypothetical protein
LAVSPVKIMDRAAEEKQAEKKPVKVVEIDLGSDNEEEQMGKRTPGETERAQPQATGKDGNREKRTGSHTRAARGAAEGMEAVGGIDLRSESGDQTPESQHRTPCRFGTSEKEKVWVILQANKVKKGVSGRAKTG